MVNKFVNKKNLVKVYLQDVEKIPQLSILMLFRKKLKLMRTYPSSSRDNLRESIIEEYREKSALKDKKILDEAIDYARTGLKQIYSSEIQRRYLLDIEVYKNEEHEKEEMLKLKKIEEENKIKVKQVKEKQDQLRNNNKLRFEEF